MVLTSLAILRDFQFLNSMIFSKLPERVVSSVCKSCFLPLGLYNRKVASDQEKQTNTLLHLICHHLLKIVLTWYFQHNSSYSKATLKTEIFICFMEGLEAFFTALFAGCQHACNPCHRNMFWKRSVCQNTDLLKPLKTGLQGSSIEIFKNFWK